MSKILFTVEIEREELIEKAKVALLESITPEVAIENFLFRIFDHNEKFVRAAIGVGIGGYVGWIKTQPISNAVGEMGKHLLREIAHEFNLHRDDEINRSVQRLVEKSVGHSLSGYEIPPHRRFGESRILQEHFADLFKCYKAMGDLDHEEKFLRDGLPSRIWLVTPPRRGKEVYKT